MLKRSHQPLQVLISPFLSGTTMLLIGIVLRFIYRPSMLTVDDERIEKALVAFDTWRAAALGGVMFGPAFSLLIFVAGETNEPIIHPSYRSRCWRGHFPALAACDVVVQARISPATALMESCLHD